MKEKCFVCGENATSDILFSWDKEHFEKHTNLKIGYAICEKHNFDDVMDKINSIKDFCCEDFAKKCSGKIIFKDDGGFLIRCGDCSFNFKYCPWCGEKT